MAENPSTVYLGYKDEEVTESNKSLLNFTVNKVGGLPDWPSSEICVPNCPICSLKRPMILQIYAPLENSKFHRTFYIFACLNPICSNLSKGWICIRTQVLEKNQDTVEISKLESLSLTAKPIWCSGADDWYEGEDDNQNEENGNIKNDSPISDDESNSLENDLLLNFENKDDENNANCDANDGAIGIMKSAQTFAEIEGEESEVVIAETPEFPSKDIISLLTQTPIAINLNNLTLKSFFISVDDEEVAQQNYELSKHVCELIQNYQINDDSESSPDNPIAPKSSGADKEMYEQAVPIHGDIVFHNFLTTIQRNPGQIIRYSRDANPILISPLHEPIPKCQNCGKECICEIQILSTLISKLKLETGEICPIEFGNVLIYTCLKSCWDTPDKMRIENVLVQPEY